MLQIRIQNKQQQKQLQHLTGPLEFGRAGTPGKPRIVLEDPFVSRDQLRIAELPNGRLEVANLSKKTPIYLEDGAQIDTLATVEFSLPIRLNVGTTWIDVSGETPSGDEAWQTIRAPTIAQHDASESLSLADLHDTLTPDVLAHWFETVISVQRAAAGSAEFYQETARAIVDLVGLDRGLVLMRREEDWEIIATHATAEGARSGFSRTILNRMLVERRTFYRGQEPWDTARSMVGVDAVVVSPILDPQEQIVGALYGLRSRARGMSGSAIRPLEAQVIQLLAAAVGAGLARLQSEAHAARTRVQLEQFVTPEFVRELERDPQLLEGRDAEITALFSDIRGFSSLSERLGPGETFRLVRDVMDCLTTCIVAEAGTVVEYVGDGVLAMWNAPIAQPDHALRACRTALAMQSKVAELSARWEGTLGRPLALGIGLNTGPARVGNTGSERKLKYGPLGHTVNLACRVEGATKRLRVPILLTGTTQRHLPPEMATRRLCQVRLAGLAQPVALCELHSTETDAAWIARRDAYERGLEQFEAGQWAEACRTLYSVLQNGAEMLDVPGLTLIGRSVECLRSPPPPGEFDPVVNFDEK